MEKELRFMTTNEFMTPNEKKIELFLRQKYTLDTFLERKAITQSQYNKSLGDLTEKMGMQEVLKNEEK